jgi:archaeal flagellar protein FlaH
MNAEGSGGWSAALDGAPSATSGLSSALGGMPPSSPPTPPEPKIHPFATTGIQGLDTHLGGGFPRGATILVLAESSNAPYIFCEQFGAGGIRDGETVYYYNLERPKAESVASLQQMARIEFPPRQLQYFDCYSRRLGLPAATLKKLRIQNHAPNVVRDLPQRLMKHRPNQGPFRVIVESLTETLRLYGLGPTLTMLNVLTGVMRLRQGVAIVMLERGLHPPNVENQIRHLVDGVMEFGIERKGFGLYPFLSITKMLGVRNAANILFYEEGPEGLKVDSTRRIG